MIGAWTIENEHKIEIFQSELWSNEWIQNAAMSSEALIILDLVKMVVQTIGQDNYGSLKVHADFKVVCELLKAKRLKSSQF